jgi:restriction system protein
MINIGRFTGQTSFVPADPDEYPNHRSVDWIARIPRDEFSQSALYEIGSAITLFLIKRNAAEFFEKIGEAVPKPAVALEPDTIDEAADNDTVTQTISR